MSIAVFLFAKTIKDTVDISRSIASSAAAASQIASAIVTLKNANELNRARAEGMRAQQSLQNSISIYDVDLFYAKVAMLSYIAKADKRINSEEMSEMKQILNVAESVYGHDVATRARQYPFIKLQA